MNDGKLGFTPGPCSVSTILRANADLIAAAPEMLEALIDTLIDVEVYYDMANMDDPTMPNFETAYENNLKPVKKATGLTWAEVKELSN